MGPVADIDPPTANVRFVPEAEVDARDKAILRAISGAMRQIEDELTEGHEVLIREPAPVLIGSRLLRAGSGAG